MASRKPKPGHYEIMWLVVMFDLPVGTLTERRKATRFRNNLLELGFAMKQFSVYLRHCENLEKAKVQAQKVKQYLVANGTVSVLYITDRQYGMMENFYGEVKVKNEAKILEKQEQLFLF